MKSWPKPKVKKNRHAYRRHLEADQKMLDKMPGLLLEMAEICDNELPENYPRLDPEVITPPMPWWGDILTDLIRETEDVITKLKKKGAFQVDLKPEVLDGLLSGMMAEGNRKEDDLYKLMREMFDQIDFASPDAEELEESVKTFFLQGMGPEPGRLQTGLVPHTTTFCQGRTQ